MTEPAETEFDDRVYLPVLPEQSDVVDLVAALRARGRDAAACRPRIVLGDGREADLPESLVEVLFQVAEAMQAGVAVTVAPRHLSWSTQEAADLLGISRMTLVRLSEAGQMPFDRPGRHRRIRMVDVLEHRRRRRHRAEDALADMVTDTERLGLYEMDPEALQEALSQARSQRRED